ncbi:MAG: nucleotidyltransferase [Candidatus Omnitrophota bacterium]|nr:nucleotidyltransferase [Candidatus Omnitrophota bacterium]
MNNQSAFHLITQIMQKENVSGVLIGGFAINFYKVTRQTADIDFLITKEDFDKISVALEKSGYRQSRFEENFVQLKSSNLSLMDIDFMFVDRETLTKILDEAKPVKITGKTFIIPSLNHLIALKLHSIKYNPKIRLLSDLPDIISLIRINDVNIHTKGFKELCLKYGTEDIYEKILEALK